MCSVATISFYECLCGLCITPSSKINATNVQKLLCELLGELMSTANFINPRKLARTRASWRGTLSSDTFLRLQECVKQLFDNIEMNVQFSLDSQSRVRLEGTAKYRAEIECPRCMKPVEQLVAANIDACIVCSDKHARETMQDCEPIIVESEKVALHLLVEDDLILSIPHDVCPDESCCATERNRSYGDQPIQEHNSPFSVLREHKRKMHTV